MALETDINAEPRSVPEARRWAWLVDGVTPVAMHEALTIVQPGTRRGDEECALVLETAAGYAPTLGILGAVLGLIRVMENLATPAGVGAGIAVAFVATVYGVGAANLLLLPLATRLRVAERETPRIGRELIIEGVVRLQQRLHPRLVEAHLAGFIRAPRSATAFGERRECSRSGDAARSRPSRDRWLIPYADFVTLLFAFFTALYAVTAADAGRLRSDGRRAAGGGWLAGGNARCAEGRCPAPPDYRSRSRRCLRGARGHRARAAATMLDANSSS